MAPFGRCSKRGTPRHKITCWNIRRTVFRYCKKRIASTRKSNSPIAVPVRFRVEAASYPAAPPTDPYVKISFIRFLSSNYLETKQAQPRLAHNFCYPASRDSNQVDYPGRWKSKGTQYLPFKFFPGYIAITASPAKPAFPRFSCTLINHFQHLVITPDTIVLIMTSKFRTHYPMLFREAPMPIIMTPLPDSFCGSAQPLGCRLALYHPIPIAGLVPVMGESKKIKRVLTHQRLLSPIR